VSALYSREVEELRRDKSPEEIKARIAALEGKKEKSSYEMKLLARFYWADDRFLEAGKMYEEAVSAAEQNNSLNGIADSISEELNELKATGMYSDEAASLPLEQPAVQKQPMPAFVKPLIIGFSAFAVVMIAAVVVLIMMLGKSGAATPVLPSESSAPAADSSQLSAQEATSVQKAAAEPATEAATASAVTKESLELVCSDIYNWEQEQYNKTLSKMMFGEEYYVMFNSFEVYKPETFGFIRYTIKDESYINEKYEKEVCLAVFYLNGKGDEKNPPDRHECYLAVQVEFDQGKARIVNPKEPTRYDAPKLNELYDKLDAQYSIYNKELTEF